jgi:hypothetical protein
LPVAHIGSFAATGTGSPHTATSSTPTPGAGCGNATSLTATGYSLWTAFTESTVGPIPSGMQIDHLCRNTLCVNPDHMEVVTNAENGRRGAGAKLTWDDVAAIRDLCHQGVPHKDIASRYGTTASYVGQIRIGRTWADQDAPPVLS